METRRDCDSPNRIMPHLEQIPDIHTSVDQVPHQQSQEQELNRPEVFLTPKPPELEKIPLTPKMPSSKASPKVIVKFTDIRQGLQNASLSTNVEEASSYLESPKDMNFHDITKTLCSPRPSLHKKKWAQKKDDIQPGSHSTGAIRKMQFTTCSDSPVKCATSSLSMMSEVWPNLSWANENDNQVTDLIAAPLHTDLMLTPTPQPSSTHAADTENKHVNRPFGEGIQMISPLQPMFQVNQSQIFSEMHHKDPMDSTNVQSTTIPAASSSSVVNVSHLSDAFVPALYGAISKTIDESQCQYQSVPQLSADWQNGEKKVIDSVSQYEGCEFLWMNNSADEVTDEGQSKDLNNNNTMNVASEEPGITHNDHLRIPSYLSDSDITTLDSSDEEDYTETTDTESETGSSPQRPSGSQYVGPDDRKRRTSTDQLNKSPKRSKNITTERTAIEFTQDDGGKSSTETSKHSFSMEIILSPDSSSKGRPESKSSTDSQEDQTATNDCGQNPTVLCGATSQLPQPANLAPQPIYQSNQSRPIAANTPYYASGNAWFAHPNSAPASSGFGTAVAPSDALNSHHGSVNFVEGSSDTSEQDLPEPVSCPGFAQIHVGPVQENFGPRYGGLQQWPYTGVEWAPFPCYNAQSSGVTGLYPPTPNQQYMPVMQSHQPYTPTMSPMMSQTPYPSSSVTPVPLQPRIQQSFPCPPSWIDSLQGFQPTPVQSYTAPRFPASHAPYSNQPYTVMYQQEPMNLNPNTPSILTRPSVAVSRSETPRSLPPLPHTYQSQGSHHQTSVMTARPTVQSHLPTSHSLQMPQGGDGRCPVPVSWPTKKRVPNPKHLQMKSLTIGSFVYTAVGKSVSKMKIIFSKRRLVYEMEWAGDLVTCDDGGRARLFSCIEIPLSTISALSVRGSLISLHVSSTPLMFMGSKPCDNTGQVLSRKVITYKRDKAMDLTNNQLSTVPFHQIELSQPRADSFLQALTDFDPSFNDLVVSEMPTDPGQTLPTARASTQSGGLKNEPSASRPLTTDSVSCMSTDIKHCKSCGKHCTEEQHVDSKPSEEPNERVEKVTSTVDDSTENDTQNQ